MITTVEVPRKMLITGGAGETGSLFTPEAIRRGYIPIVTISEKPRNKMSAGDRATHFQDEMEMQTGVRPKVVAVDLSQITTQQKAADFVDSLELGIEEPIHFAAFAAGGLPVFTIGKEYLRLKGLFEKEKIMQLDLTKSTNVIKNKIETDSSIMEAAMALNFLSPRAILEELIKRGHVGKTSVVALLSSSLSDDFNPGKHHSFLGPAFYLPVAYTKKLVAGYFEGQSKVAGFKYLDFIAPEIIDSSVGKYFEDFGTYISSTQKDKPPIRMAFVTREMTAQMLANQINVMESGSERFSRVYLGEDGKVYNSRPNTWEHQPLRGYL